MCRELVTSPSTADGNCGTATEAFGHPPRPSSSNPPAPGPHDKRKGLDRTRKWHTLNVSAPWKVHTPGLGSQAKLQLCFPVKVYSLADSKVAWFGLVPWIPWPCVANGWQFPRGTWRVRERLKGKWKWFLRRKRNVSFCAGLTGSMLPARSHTSRRFPEKIHAKKLLSAVPNPSSRNLVNV